jgi:Zn-dependent peptidase ImmA (M78 family)
VRYVRDTLHGFRERPHYDPAELDTMFERIVVDFLKQKHGKAAFPIVTEDITVLIERDVSDLDQYADLSSYGANVEGVTEFSRRGKPKVLISESVHRFENRLRTTLTHEYGHVVLHGYLFATEERKLGLLPGQKPSAIYCKRDDILGAKKVDWMEWQAGYACGAMLMPRTHVRNVVAEIQKARNIYGAVSPSTENGGALIEGVMDQFSVSRDAATVRLKILGYLGAESAIRSLFS